MNTHSSKQKEGFATAYKSVLEAPDLNDGEVRTLLYLVLLGQRKIAYDRQTTVENGLNKSRKTIIRQ